MSSLNVLVIVRIGFCIFLRTNTEITFLPELVVEEDDNKRKNIYN